MLTTKEIRNVKVYIQPKPGKEFTKDGLPKRGKKIGKVFKTVFDPTGMRVVGFIINRPDLLFMFKRADKFLALDSMDISDGAITVKPGGGSWDEAAIKRLGIDYDKCYVWEGMQVRTTDGSEMGRVDDISFDEDTGEVNSFFLDEGGAARALIGSFEIDRNLVVGYKNDRLLVKPDADKETRLTGGLAAKAGTATAKAQIKAKEGAKKVDTVASDAVNVSSYGIGRAVGRIKTSVTGAVDEFKAEADLSEKPAEKKPAAKAVATTKKPAVKSTSGTTTKKPATKATTAKTSSTSSSAKSKTTAAKTTTKKAASSQPKEKDASQAVADHLKGASTMFSDFKREFDKASKGK